MKTQMYMFSESHRKIADANNLFLEFVKEGMTREELEKLIKLRPFLWGRFEHWLDKLPSSTNQ